MCLFSEIRQKLLLLQFRNEILTLKCANVCAYSVLFKDNIKLKLKSCKQYICTYICIYFSKYDICAYIRQKFQTKTIFGNHLCLPCKNLYRVGHSHNRFSRAYCSFLKEHIISWEKRFIYQKAPLNGYPYLLKDLNLIHRIRWAIPSMFITFALIQGAQC